MNLLQGKTALITGGGSGIGLAIAERFHGEGARVVICGRRLERLERAGTRISADGERVLSIRADVTSDADRRRLVDMILQTHDRLDILVNSAGIMRFAALEQASLEQWDELMRVNAWAPWRLMAEVMPIMRRGGGGSVINISSLSGIRPNPGSGLYCASKAALQMLSQVAALEAAGDQIRVNVLCPGMVEDTELGDAVFGRENVSSFYSKFAPLHPLGRNGKPLDIAEAALFLASEASAWLTGTVIPVDGGRHLTMNRP